MKGKLIVIEGLDGSGKATQAKILADKMRSDEKKVSQISFPNYSNPSSTLVQMYLKGEVGTLEEVNAYAAASFYSLDRYISFKTIWEKDYNLGKIIIADRYTTSNLSHQMAKLPMTNWTNYISWLNHYEYELLGLPCPDLVIYLDMHPEASKKLLSLRYDGDESKKDIHEKAFDYLMECRQAGLFAAKELDWCVIHCNDAELNPLSLDDISHKIAQACNTL